MDNFTSEHELFLFSKVRSINAMVVGAFPKDAPVNLARVILNQITSKLVAKDVIEQDGLLDLNRPEKLTFVRDIPNLINQVTDLSVQSEYFDNIISKCEGVNLAMKVDIEDKTIQWKFARPPPMYQPKRLQDCFLIHNITSNMVEKIGLGIRYEYIIAENGNYSFAAYYNGFDLSIVQSNLASSEKVLTAVSQLGFRHMLPALIADGDQPDYQESYRLEKTKFTSVTDSSPSLNIAGGVFLQSCLNSVNNFFEETHNRTPERYMFLTLGKSEDILLQIERHKEDNHYHINLIKSSQQA